MILSVWARPAELCKDTEGEGGREREGGRGRECKSKRKTRECPRGIGKVDSQAAQTSEKEGGEGEESQR